MLIFVGLVTSARFFGKSLAILSISKQYIVLLMVLVTEFQNCFFFPAFYAIKVSLALTVSLVILLELRHIMSFGKKRKELEI